MLVYVINKNGNPLMPCKPAKARHLLRDKKAKVIKRTPFTIKLLWDCEENVQDLTLGIDSGSRYIGSAVRDKDNQVYYLSQIELRQNIKSKLDTRRMYRRTRRSRKTRYRKARWANRKNSIKSDRYPPTIVSKFNSLLKELWFVSKILPIKDLIIETGTFDPHAMQNPALIKHPWAYQKGLMFGYYNIKQYILSRDNYTCQYCKGKSKDSKLQVHHIIPRSQGGSNRPNNLLTLCKTCHDKLHAGNIKLTKRHIKNLNLHHATHMNILQSLIRKNLSYTETYGYITKVIREYFKIPKAHCYDALCVEITEDKMPTLLNNTVLFKKSISKGRYQQTWGIRSEKKYPKNKVFGFKTWDKVIYQGVTCFVKGMMSTGYYVLCNILGKKINFKPMAKPNTLQRVTARKSWIMTEVVIPST
jgi:hypothetical protein